MGTLRISFNMIKSSSEAFLIDFVMINVDRFLMDLSKLVHL